MPKDSMLESARLSYRPVAMDDAGTLASLATEPHVRRYLLDGEIVSKHWCRNEIRASQELFESRGAGMWLVLCADEPIGFCGYKVFDELGPEPQLLYALVERCTGRGFATEIAQTLLNAAREAGWKRVYSAVDEPNVASIRVLDKVGFARCGATPGAFGAILLFERGL